MKLYKYRKYQPRHKNTTVEIIMFILIPINSIVMMRKVVGTLQQAVIWKEKLDIENTWKDE